MIQCLGTVIVRKGLFDSNEGKENKYLLNAYYTLCALQIWPRFTFQQPCEVVVIVLKIQAAPIYLQNTDD